MIPLYSLEFWENNAPPYQVKYTHHTLRSHIYGRTNGWYQNVLRGPHNCFISSNIIQYSKLGCSVFTTKSEFHQSSLLTLDPKVKILIPVAALFVGITLTFSTILKHDIILCLFTLLTIIRGGKTGRYMIQGNLSLIHGIEGFENGSQVHVYIFI